MSARTIFITPNKPSLLRAGEYDDVCSSAETARHSPYIGRARTAIYGSKIPRVLYSARVRVRVRLYVCACFFNLYFIPSVCYCFFFAVPEYRPWTFANSARTYIIPMTYDDEP